LLRVVPPAKIDSHPGAAPTPYASPSALFETREKRRHTMNTNALIITNSGAPPATNDIRGLKPPIDIPNGWLWLIFTLVLVALAVAVVFCD